MKYEATTEVLKITALEPLPFAASNPFTTHFAVDPKSVEAKKKPPREIPLEGLIFRAFALF